MGIREDQEAQASKFVSVRDLLTGLSVSEAVSLSDAASFLLRNLSSVGDKQPRFVRQDSESLTYFSAVKKMDEILRFVSARDGFEGDYDDPTGWQFNAHGWFRQEIALFLKSINQAFPDCCSSAWKPAPKLPDWLKSYENRIRLSINETVCLLVGADPEVGEPYGIDDNDAYAHMRRWKAALFDAMNSNKWGFDESTFAMNRDEEQTIEHSGIKAWARDTNAPWPFLGDSPAPAPESVEGRALIRKLAAANECIAKLEQDLKAKRQEVDLTLPPTPLMKLANDVQKRYWGENWDPNDSQSRTTQEVIVDWILSTYPAVVASRATAQAVEKVACPFDRNPAKKK